MTYSVFLWIDLWQLQKAYKLLILPLCSLWMNLSHVSLGSLAHRCSHGLQICGRLSAAHARLRATCKRNWSIGSARRGPSVWRITSVAWLYRSSGRWGADLARWRLSSRDSRRLHSKHIGCTLLRRHCQGVVLVVCQRYLQVVVVTILIEHLLLVLRLSSLWEASLRGGTLR